MLDHRHHRQTVVRHTAEFMEKGYLDTSHIYQGLSILNPQTTFESDNLICQNYKIAGPT